MQSQVPPIGQVHGRDYYGAQRTTRTSHATQVSQASLEEQREEGLEGRRPCRREQHLGAAGRVRAERRRQQAVEL